MSDKKVIQTKVIYYITILISTVLIIISFIPYGINGAEVFLQGIGCSGLTAGIMAIFIEFSQLKQKERRIIELRQYYLVSMYFELKHLLERVIWFEHVIDNIELDKDISYYQSLEFVVEAYSLNCDITEKFENVESEIQDIIRKYDKTDNDNVKNLNWEKVEKMFNIIGFASCELQNEVDKLYRNRIFLIVNELFSNQEIDELLACLSKHVQFLQVKNTNYSTSLVFLLQAFKKIRKMGNYDDEFMCITWHLPQNVMQMVLEQRRKISDC